VTDCHRLELPAAEGKNYLTDATATQGGMTARQARQALERKTGRPVVSGDNF
jgi:hypothetical protein